MGVDHLILGVVGTLPDVTSSECVRYNNYHSVPIECGGPGQIYFIPSAYGKVMFSVMPVQSVGGGSPCGDAGMSPHLVEGM